MSKYKIIFGFLLIFATGINASQITFVVIPDTIPQDSSVYVAGNHPELGEWLPNRVQLDYQGKNTWKKSINFEEGTYLEVKFIRGSWESEAVDKNGIEFPNFRHMVKGDTALIFRIPNWRDLQKGITIISQQRFENKIGRIELVEDWKFHEGDNQLWASPGFDDADWEWRNPQISNQDKWIGIGWFRKNISVDSSLLYKPMGLYLRQIGASEIYLNGEKIYSIGTVANNIDEERGMIHRDPMVITFTSATNNILAIRHSNFTAKNYESFRMPFGFSIILIRDLQNFIYSRSNDVRISSIYQMIFTILPITLAFIHLLLFLFYKRSRQNLFFSICMIGFAGLVFTDFQGTFASSISSAIILNQIGFLFVNIAIFFGIITLHQIIRPEILKYDIFVGVFQFLLVLWAILYPVAMVDIVFYIFLGLVIIEIIRVGLKSSLKEDWIMGVGLGIMILSVVYQILLNFNIVPAIIKQQGLYVYGILALSIAVSVNLAREFATMNFDILNREHIDREKEIQRRILEADNNRKTEELEEARRLQLSMLPSEVPQIKNLDIAVLMETATEVGGDYYDFYLDDDTLTMAIGDATGHGIKAGVMVALIKNIFNSIGRTFYLPDFLNHCARMIKKMNLGNLYMSLQIVRIKNNKLIFSSAGMPPLLIWRADTGELEELMHKVLPLGGPDVVYKQSSTDLAPGDTLLLMTDGYFELFNKNNEILDLPNVKKIFTDCAQQSPNEIIDYLVEKGKEWSKNRPQNDDITFVVAKVK
jgi:serine phosphatase RsbU (regulator of sigma subunit)